MKSAENVLSKKLLAYSSFAAGVLPMGAIAQVQYRDANPDILVPLGDSALIDMNLDGFIDFKFYASSSSISSTTATTGGINIAFSVDFVGAVVAPRPGLNSIMGSMVTAGTGSTAQTFNNPYGLGAGNSINSTQNWQTASVQNLAMDMIMDVSATMGGFPVFSTVVPMETGNFMDPNKSYIGVRFDISGNTHYGWIRAKVDTANSAEYITIYDWAYHTIPNTPLTADEGNPRLSISESDRAFSKLWNADKVLYIEDLKKSGLVEIYNLNGQKVVEEEIQAGNSKINLSGLTEQVYLLNFRDEEGESYRRKFILH